MTNNDVLRSFRYALELAPADLAAFFSEAGVRISLSTVAALLKNEDEPGFLPLDDEHLGLLLDGVIATYRGKRESSERAEPQARPVAMTNNRILAALRIAFELRDDDLQACMRAAGREVSKSELGALFRRPDHRNYQACGDQFLRAFLRGLGLWYREERGRR